MRRCQAKGGLRLPFGVLAVLLAAVPLAAGCADVAGEAVQQDLAQLRQDLNALTLTVHRGRGDTETVVRQLERRTREQAGDSARQLAALGARLDGLAAELARASARLDEVSQRLESLSRQLPAGGGAGPRSGPPAAPAPAGKPSAAGPTAEETYQAAYLDFSKGHYPLAISAFQEMLRRFPDSPLADSAQYGIGEAYFSLARASAASGRAEEASQALQRAVREFRKVIVAYPRGSKVPTALYKEALALVELKQTALAQARLQYLVDHFPQSEEAPLARERLAALKE